MPRVQRVDIVGEPVEDTLRAGTSDIYCGVPGDKALGMDVHITVS